MNNIQEKLIEDGKSVFAPTYNQLPIVLDGGKGVHVFDVEGNDYLDFSAGIAVNLLGYGDEGFSNALKRVIDNGIFHCSNIYWNKYSIEVANKLTNLSKMDQVFFCNSGTEANEAALKVARKYGKSKDINCTSVISMDHSFHGRTFGSLSTTGQAKYQESFFPLLEGVSYATYNDIKSVEALISSTTCAIIVEPIQGEGGIIPADKEFLQGLRELADKNDLILIFDEVQCGMGRTSEVFAFQSYGVTPDVVTLAKALGGGLPCGAMITKGKADNILIAGDHGSTFGGNLLAMAAASYVLDQISDKKFLNHVNLMSKYLVKKLYELKDKYPKQIVDIRGLGLMIGMQMTNPPQDIIKNCFDNKLLLLKAGTDVIRFVPPLVICESDIDEAISILDKAIEEVASK
ncbi:MAG: aspartate aminotransferase family protein [Spirochaetaceae bacterium]|nr:aspartate aminotransferase family protein [Spirochaetaceae bacterium]